MMKFDIFMCVPGLPFDGDTINRGSLGGSETAGVYMARELARLGHRVTVFSNTPKEGSFDGVRYIPIAAFNDASRMVPHDICIIQRSPQLFATTKASKLNVLWQHDLATKSTEQNFKGSLWDIDVVMLLSDFHAEQYKEVYNADRPLVHVTRNGIDLSAFKTVDLVQRNHKRLFYAARPERGMDVLLGSIMPRLLEKDPDITLAIAGYDNVVDHMRPFYDYCGQLLNNLGASASHLGALSKSELYQQLAGSALYTYPTPSPINANFAEISCILAMEAQACGTPIIASAKGALPETVKGGVLVGGEPSSAEYVDRFVTETLGLLNNRERWNDLSNTGKRHAKNLGWDKVAEEWTEEFERRIRNNNDSAVRKVIHFMRNSDVDALDHVIEQVEDKEFGAQLKTYIDTAYDFRTDDAKFKDHYLTHGEDTSKALASQPIENFANNFTNSPEPRFQYIEQFIKSKGVKTVLDYGCGHGWMPIYLHNRTGVSVDGVDVDDGAVEWCRKFAAKFATDKLALNFSTDLNDFIDEEKYDCVIVSEVLEHVRDPIELMKTLEGYVNEGGHVLFTVPFGPAEFGTPHWYNFRNHIREWDLHDLHDIFGRKKNFAVGAVFSHFNEITGDPVGSWVGIYEKGNGVFLDAHCEGFGEIDWRRKLALQRPRQTVSLNVMAGPGSGEQIRWMLNSVKDHVDEIVIAYTGMTQQDRDATSGFAIKFVAAPDPKVEGFETPRNIGLAACTMDWVLWLDTDEKLTDPQNIMKYLRDNIFVGYGVKQHHFAVDTTFSPDLPVRLFRRNPKNGKAIRWYGMIHEHPEMGLNEGPGEVIVVSDVNIAHTGYLAESGRRKRFTRNLPLLNKDIQRYPDRILQKHFIMRDKVQMAVHELQVNGGKVTPEINQACRDVVGLYQKYFAGKNVYMAIDSRHWYSEALRILNEGFEVAWSLDAALGSVTPSAPKVLRYASKEDLLADLTTAVEERTKPLTGRYL